MDQEDPEERIAELERQLAEAQAAAGHVGAPQPVPPPTTAPASAPQSGPAMTSRGTWISVNGGDFQQVGTHGAGGALPPEAMEKINAALQQGKFTIERQESGLDAETVSEILRQAGLGGGAGPRQPLVIQREDSFGYPGQRDPHEFGARAGDGPRRPAATAGFWRAPFRAIGKFFFLIPITLAAGYMSEGAIPPSALWMSRVVCSSPYHLRFNPTYHMGSSGRGSQTSWLCANYGSSYPVSEFTIFGVQCALFALVLCVAGALGFLTWRLSRARWLTSMVATVAIVAPLTGVFAYGITSTPMPGPKQLQSAGGLRDLLSFTRTWFGDTLGYRLSVENDLATLERPDPQNNRLKKSYTYRTAKWTSNLEGEWDDFSSSSRSSGDSLADLSRFDVTAVTARLPGAAQALGLTDVKSTYLDIAGRAGESLALSISLSGPENGSIDLNPDGSVKALHPPKP